MKYQELKLNLKTELKQLTHDIRELRSKRKTVQFGYVPGLFEKRQAFRIKHIAYCLFKGTPFEKIEQKWQDPQNYTNQYCKDQAIKLFNAYLSQVEKQDEAARTNS